MNQLEDQLRHALLRCHHLLRHVETASPHRTSRSANTERDYLKLGQSLLKRARHSESGLMGVVENTGRPTTFYKRLAALRYTLHVRQLEILDGIAEPLSMVQMCELLPILTEQNEHLAAVATLKSQGLKGPRAKRNGKRRALTGLPSDWREALCRRGASGKYGVALLVAALTGCRPAELESGVKVWREVDAGRHRSLIHFEIVGAKVKAGQGQPVRHIAYKEEDGHPLVAMLKPLLSATEDGRLLVKIEKALNFTVEVRRLAASLWPKHLHAITPYCLRHQWAADAKCAGTADTVSRGLGHLSDKTQRRYGTASQACQGGMLRPVEVDAERAIRRATPRNRAVRQDRPEPKV
jgi:integrase